MVKVELEEAKESLPALVAAAVNGEAVFITVNDQTVRLVPENQASIPRKAGSAKGMVWVSDDFDAPLGDFREYME